MGINRRSLLAAIALATIFQVIYGSLDSAPDFDESVYLGLARSIREHLFPISQGYPPHPFFKHPPLHFYILALSTTIFGDSLPGARAGISILSIILLIIFYRLAAKTNPTTANLAVLLLALNPAFLFYAHSAYMETTTTLLVVLVLCLVAGAGGRVSHLRGGLALGLALLTKYYAVTLATGIFFFWLYTHKKYFLSEGRWILFAIAALILGGWFAGSYTLARSDFLSQTGSWFMPHQTGSVPSWRSVGNFKYAIELAGVITPVVAFCGLIGLLRGVLSILRRRVEKDGLFAFFLLAHLAFLALSPIKDIKYSAPILPILCAYSAGILLPLLKRKGRAPWPLILVLIATSTPIAYFVNPFTKSLHPNIYLFSLNRDNEYRNYKKAGELILKIKKEDDFFLSSERAAIIGYYARLSHKDLWTGTSEELSEDLERADYIVLNSKSPYLVGARRERIQAFVYENMVPIAHLPGRSVDLTLWNRSPAKERH